MTLAAECPPVVDARVFDATVVVAERATYECASTPEGAAASCIEARGTAPCAEPLVVTLSDGKRLAKQHQPPFALAICDLPAGTHVATICTPDGARSCTVEVAADRGAGLTPKGSLPHRYRYRVATDGIELVLNSDDVELQVHDRRRFTIARHVRDPSLIGACDVAPIVTKPPARGCGHCASSSPGLALAGIVLAFAMRRRR